MSLLNRRGLAAALALLSAPLAAQTAENVLVVVNESSPDSVTIGEYYARKRGVPAANLCRIRTPAVEVVGRDGFEREILEPVADCLRSQRLQDQVHYIVTTRGLPLTVAGAPGPAGDLASLDSELTLLYQYLLYDRHVAGGRVANPYYGIDYGGIDLLPFDRRANPIYLVTRLSGPEAVDALLLVDRALRPAREGLFAFDLPSERRTSQTDWLREARQALEGQGARVVVESSAALLQSEQPVLGYAGWGGEDTSFGDFPPSLNWAAGGIALLFDPDSARGSEGRHSALDRLVASGASGAAGFAADPTADAYIRPQALFPAYASGYNLAESFYLGLRYLGWRQVILGDPLACPFPEKARERRRRIKPCGIDEKTLLPSCFAERRKFYLVEAYTTSQEAVEDLLRAEALTAMGRLPEARAALRSSLSRDPYIAESHLLQSRLMEAAGDFQGAFTHYERAHELGKRRTKDYLKLARLALDQLGDAGKAEKYAATLYRALGSVDTEIALLWARIQEAKGETSKAMAAYRRIIAVSESPPVAALAALGRLSAADSPALARDFLEKAAQRLEELPEEHKLRREVPRLLSELPTAESARAEAPAQAVVDGASDSEPEAAPAVRPAQIVERAPTEYPAEAQRAGVEGTVVLRLLIDERGQMLKSTVIHGPKALAKAAQESVAKWRFRPRLNRGRAEPSYLTVAIRFEIREEDGPRSASAVGDNR